MVGWAITAKLLGVFKTEEYGRNIVRMGIADHYDINDTLCFFYTGNRMICQTAIFPYFHIHRLLIASS